ncbi:iron-containing alcohol dehydrogenase family protein [Halomarina litorea]|uniref:iron-containing alcohol dehydrogenase family protein n=1 Tax=Halomarina litorea TaxID=2961595 RepID=UPI0020C42CE2|nr:iron-containing alcohol dehydrogenase family protein [Halomarina sp. BCD28]
MDPIGGFEYDNVAGRIAFGRGCVADLSEALANLGADRALVVCGSNVGANRGTMDPIREGLGDRLVGIFDGTAPDKNARCAFEGREAMADHGADALVAVGGGSSIDVARAMRALHADGRSYDEVREAAEEQGRLPIPDADFVPLVAVPTTLAGADLSTVGSVTFREGEATLGAGYIDPDLMLEALFYDPDLFETTPVGALVGSAMNGFDKGIEALYARGANPLTDATSLRGLALLRPSLPHVADDDRPPGVMDNAVAGIVAVQYGRATRDPGLLSLIHAFGHGLREEGVQQGVAHAVMAPPALDYLFEQVDGRRDLLAESLGVGDDEDPAEGVVSAVADVRDGMGLPSRLRDLEEVEEDALPRIARVVAEDGFMANAPAGLDATEEELLAVLEGAW